MSVSSEFFTVEGPLQAVRLASGKINLLEDMQNGALFTGIAAGLAGQAGVLANSASLAMYDGEDVEHLACLLNGKLAVGTFEWLEDIHVDDDVKLVVSEIEDGPLYIHAILRKRDQLLWLPYSVGHTRWGWIMHSVKLWGGLLVGGWLLLGLILLFSGKGLSGADFVTNIAISFSIFGLVSFLGTKDMMPLGGQAEAIFKALNIPHHRRFRIKPYSLMMEIGIENRQRKGGVFRFDNALSAHKERFNLP